MCCQMILLIGDCSHEYYWNKVRNRMHNKHTRVHCPRMLVWCSLLLLVVIAAINVHAVHANLLCKCLHNNI